MKTRTPWNKIGEEIIGQKYGRLTIIAMAGRAKSGGTLVQCRCDCGGEKTVLVARIRIGNVKSCGCLSRESRAERSLKHGHNRNRKPTREYIKWQGMHGRCRNPGLHNYHHYGGRGIKVCERWSDFRNFLADMGPCPDGYELDRIDPDKNYEPGNVRWATKEIQEGNKRRTHWVEINGIRKPLDTWRKELAPQLSMTTTWRRFKQGWPIEKLFVGTNGKNKTAR